MQLLNLFCNYQNLDPVKVFLFRQCEDKFCRPDEKKWPTYVSCIYLISLPVASCGIGFVVLSTAGSGRYLDHKIRQTIRYFDRDDAKELYCMIASSSHVQNSLGGP